MDALHSGKEWKPKYARVISFFHQAHNRSLFKQRFLPEHLHFKMTSGPRAFDGGHNWNIVDKTAQWLLERKTETGKRNTKAIGHPSSCPPETKV